LRRAAAVDANQARVVAALRRVGASVQPLHAVGKGVPDLLVGFRGVTWLVECKDGSKRPSSRKLTPDQVEWHAAWRGGPVAVVLDEFAAVEIITRGPEAMEIRGEIS
jgi:hypothetical protein